MSGQIASLANTFLREYVVDGLPSSGINNPSKADGMAVFSVIDSSITGGVFFFDTWAHLQPFVPTAGAHAGAYVVNDPGTHTDPVVGGVVANQGVYSYSTAPAGWQRVGNLDAVLAKSWANLLGATVDGTEYSAKEYAVGVDIRSAGRGSAKDWATFLGAAVDTVEFSAKEYAVGADIRVAGKGSAKDWATLLGGLVDTVDYSAKEYAVGTDIRIAGKGSAKDWATLLGIPVDGTGYSAKEWAVGTDIRGLPGMGSAKDWASYTGGPVDGTSYSAAYYAASAISSAASIQTTLTSFPTSPTVDPIYAHALTMGGYVFAGLEKNGRWAAPWREFGAMAAYKLPQSAYAQTATAGVVSPTNPNLVTVTVPNTTGLAVGQLLTFAGFTPATYNGTFAVQALTPTTITYGPYQSMPFGPTTVQGTVTSLPGSANAYVARSAAFAPAYNSVPGVQTGLAPIQLTTSGDVVHCEANDRFVRLVRSNPGLVYAASTFPSNVTISDDDMSGINSAAAGTTALTLLLQSGQSTSNGLGDANVVTQAPLNPGVILMWNSLKALYPTSPRIGSNTVQQSQGTTGRNLVPADYMGFLVDAYETNDSAALAGESAACGMGYTAARSLPAHTAAIVQNNAVGGSAENWTARGSPSWFNMLECQRRAKLMCQLNGWAYTPPAAADFIWGEASFSGSNGARPAVLTTHGSLLDYANSFQADFNPTAIVTVSPPSSWGSSTYKYLCDGLADRFLETMRQFPSKVLVVGPRYMITPYANDGVHYLAKGQRQLGCYHGRAVASIIAGSPRPPLYITAVNLAGTVLTLTWSRSNLALLTAIVTNPGGAQPYGFQLFTTAANTPSPITAITLSGFTIAGNQLTINLSAAPAAGTYLGVAYFNPNGAGGTSPGGPTTGPRCCLCSQSTDLDADGNAMHDWACHQSIQIA